MPLKTPQRIQPIKKGLFRTLAAFCLLILAVAGFASAATQSFRYRESTGDAHRLYDWRLEAGPPVKIVSTDDQRTFTNWCAEDGNTLKWQIETAAGERLVALREGNRIHLSGRYRGESIERIFDIDEKPWFQPLSFSLRAIVDGDDNHRDFWTIRSDTLELLAMRAEREETETLAIGPETVAAVRIRVAPRGWKGMLWKCRYWFRAADGVFVRYHGVHGPPGTPPTVVELVDEGRGG